MPAAVLIFLVVFAIFIVFSAVKIIPEYERALVFRFGRCLEQTKGPGLIIIIPFVDKVQRVDLRTVTMDVPPQDVITRDNVSVKVNAVVYFRVLHPRKAVLEVENYLYATSQLAQTTMRSVCGMQELDYLLTERDELNASIQEILDKHTDPWGVKVSVVEVKQIDLPVEMQRAMAKQAEAERERRSKIIHAEGEAQAAERLAQAADVMDKSPVSIQLRYLQTLSDIATENNSTILFPLPLDLVKVWMDKLGKGGGQG